MVLAQNVEVSTDARAFSKEEFESRRRTGAPTSLARHDMGLSTIIGRVDKDASGRRIDADMKVTMRRLRTWDFRTQAYTPTDRNLMFASNELNKLKHKLALTDAIIEKTAYIYRKAHERKLGRGRTMASMVAASLYTACRQLDTQRSLKEVAAAANMKMKDLSRAYRLLVNEFDLDIPLPDPLKSVSKVATKLGLSEKIMRDAVKAMKEIRKAGGTAGKYPMGLAGSVLYLTCVKNGEDVTQEEVADAAGVTEVTIRNRIKQLKNNHPKLFGL